MIFKGLLFFLLPVISSSVFAQNSDWLYGYLRSKSFNCKMSQEQFTNQIRAHVDANIQRLEASLKGRGSELQSITQQRDQIEIGVFPRTAGLDFYVLEPVTVVLGKPGASLTFQIQSTYYLENGKPTVQKGLWFPLAVQDSGRDKPCKLNRVVVNESQRRFLPSIDLATGEPPRTLIQNLIDVVDVSSTVTPIPPPPPPVAPAEKPEEEPRQEVKPKKKHYERRRHHRPRRRHHYRRHRRTRSEAPAPAAEPPPPRNECSGDLSTWQAVTCALTGQKID